MLEIANLSKNFAYNNQEIEVIKNISLSAKEGEFVCFLGPTGCGKTILLYLIANFLPSSAGKISVNGQEVRNPGKDRIMMFQDYVLFPWKTVYENVLFGLEKSGLSHKQKSRLVDKYLELVGLENFKDWHIHKLSGGMSQRVAFARALISNPKILLMDEPFSALDSQYRRFLRKNLVDIWQKTGQTILFVTHSINEAVYLADTIYLFTRRPAEVKKVYKVNLPRPRNVLDTEFAGLAGQIEEDLMEEFKNGFNEKEAPLDHLINFKL